MTKILWDQIGQKLYETGVDHGVLYLPNGSGVYDNGWAWNGLTTVTESPPARSLIRSMPITSSTSTF